MSCAHLRHVRAQSLSPALGRAPSRCRLLDLRGSARGRALELRERRRCPCVAGRTFSRPAAPRHRTPSVGPGPSGLRRALLVHLRLSLRQGRAQAQPVRTPHVSLGCTFPLPHRESSETAPQVGTLLPGVGDCVVCDLIKGRGRTQAAAGGPAGHNDRARASQTLWSPAQEPGPFLPQTSMPRSRGPEHVAEAPHAPCHSPDHSSGLLSPVAPPSRWTSPKQLEPDVVPRPARPAPALPPVLRHARAADAE